MEWLETIKTAVIEIREASDTSKYIVLLLAAILFLSIKKGNEKRVKKMTEYVILCFFVFLFPITIRFFQNAAFEQYVRIFWIIPSGILIPYAAVTYSFSIKEKRQRDIFAGCCAVFLALMGNFIYTYTELPQEKRITNEYRVSEEVLQIYNILNEETEGNMEIKLLTNSQNPMSEIRRINGNIKLVFGNDIEFNENYNSNIKMIYEELSKEEIDLETVIGGAKEEEADFAVLYRWAEYNDSLISEIQKGNLEEIDVTPMYAVLKIN